MGTWARDGEVWIVGLEGSSTPLKDSKGLSHIAALLARPGDEVAVLELIAVGEGHAPGPVGHHDPTLVGGRLGDAGPLLDVEAKAAYRSRLEELRSELEEAERFNDPVRAERARTEMEFLARELAAAVGLGGRDRRVGSASERARVNITRAIKTTIDRIAAYDEALAAHLRSTLKTGAFCSYRPYPLERVEWDFTGAGAAAAAPAAPVAPEPEPSVPDEPVPARARPRRPWRGHELVERDAELAELEQALELVSAGSGDLLVVDGPPGIGKSALLAAIGVEAATRGFKVLSARGSRLESEFGFGVARQVFDAALRELSEDERAQLLRGAVTPAALMLGYAEPTAPAEVAGDSPGASLAVLNGLFWLTAGLAERQPLLVLIDDVQWADAPSAAWLTFSTARVAEVRVLFVLGARPLGADADAALSELLDSGDAGAILLGPLGEPSVAQIVRTTWPDASKEFCAACYSASGGNPFYLHELISTARAAGIEGDAGGAARLSDVTPESVSRLVVRRLKDLPEPARRLAHACAVLGGEAELDVAASVARMDTDSALAAAESLAAAGILSPRQPLDFVHPLIRASVDADVPFAERTHLHELAAQVLAEREAPANVVAMQLLRTRPAANAGTVHLLRQAATQACAHGAPGTATVMLQRALAEPPDHAEVPATLLELARAHYDLGERREALDQLQRALGLAEAIELRAEIVLELCREFDESDVAASIDLLDDAIARLGDRGVELRHRLEARAVELLANAAIVSASPHVRQVFDERLGRVPEVASGDSAGERELRAIYAAHKAVAGEIAAGDAHAIVTEALDDGVLMRRLGAGISSADAALEVLCMVDAFDQADRHAREAERIAREHGVIAAEGWACMWRAVSALQRGALLEADALLRSVFAVVAQTRTPYVAAVAHQVRAWVAVERGDLIQAEAACAALDPSVSPMGAPYARGRLHAASGAHDLAAPEFRAAVEALDVIGRWRGVLGSPRIDLVLSLAALGESREALPLAQAAAETARRFGAASALGAALRALGHATGGDEGIAHLTEAVAALAPSQAALGRAHALHDLGSAQRAAGRSDEALENLRHALDLATRWGGLSLRERTRGELMAAGEDTPALAPTGAALLTPAELRIAKLAAEGSPNLEIAQALFLTVPAVERTLDHVAGKLGIPERDQLGAALDAEASTSSVG